MSFNTARLIDGVGVPGKEKIKFVLLSLPGFQYRGIAKLRANRPAMDPVKVRARCVGRECSD